MYVTLIFVNVIFFQWWTTLCYIVWILDEEEQQGKLQDNVIQSGNKMISKNRQLWGQGKQLFYFFFTVICVTYHIYLIKCTLDKMPGGSKIIKNISTLFSVNLVSIKLCEKSTVMLKIIKIIIIIIIIIIVIVIIN